MSLVVILAHISCDRCGERFEVDLDAAYKPPADWTLWDCAEDAVRGGVSLHDNFLKSTSVQNGQMLCPTCTRKIDEAAGDPDS